ncbi:MAG: AAA family ATPase [Bacteroidota bacterium]
MNTTNIIELKESIHPHKLASKRYESLVGLDSQKEKLLHNLKLFFGRKTLDNWRKKHHPRGLPFFVFDNRSLQPPLILLSGEVGCGKTELAQTIATPLSSLVGGKRIRVMETPSDIRGGGRVGELSQRLTAAFEQARYKLKPKELGILIIDEADDLATQRSQMQAHHEDRAGVNVLIKEIDRLERDQIPLAVILITNRADVLDPAVLRRAATQLAFSRPNNDSFEKLMELLLQGVTYSDDDIRKLVAASRKDEVRFTFSDVVHRIARQSLIEAYLKDRPFSPDIILEVIQATKPTPLLT